MTVPLSVISVAGVDVRHSSGTLISYSSPSITRRATFKVSIDLKGRDICRGFQCSNLHIRKTYGNIS